MNVFDFTDYRKFLEDYYEQKKSTDSSFSYQLMSERAGLNKGFVYNVIKGKRKLSKSNLLKICGAIGLNKTETDYFENLVGFNQAKSLNEKKHYFDKLNRYKYKDKTKTEIQLIRKDQYEFYSTWYHSAVRSIIDMYKFNGNYAWLARMVHPSISVKQAKHSVELLTKLGIIQKQKNGFYEISDKNITTGKEITGLAIQNFHSECADLSKKAIQDLPKDERNITGLTMGISQSTYSRICEKILKFQNQIAEIVNEDSCADRVYQLNFHFFPMSKTDCEMKKRI